MADCFSGDTYRLDETMSEDKATAEAISKIQWLYDSGTPLFTKETIRDLCQQLEKFSKKGEKVSVRGLDGVAVDFEVENGCTIDFWDDLEYIMGPAFVDFLSIQMLTTSSYNPCRRVMYCSLRVSHHMKLRNKTTKEPVDKVPTRSREEAEEFFKTMRQEWEASKPCKQLRSALASTKTCRISKIVAFALASIAESHSERSARRSAFQHALVLTLQDIFSKANPGKTVCYAQDPIYTETDNSVLGGFGITILDHPRAFLEVDDSSVVVSCSPNLAVKQIVSELARPAVLIWDGFDLPKSEILETDPSSPRVKKMIHNSYDELEFPGDVDDFGGLVILVRRAAASSSV
ncbi:MAG: hypothetical protein M1839_003223 [Geoglossum umbratile]|nr:MAG: hypothetical protein M1839_003223 [Geoglossum umbratile]